MEYDWEFEEQDEKLPNDDLLSCLVLLSKYYKHPVSASSLVAGLPLKKGRLVVSKFALAAQRVDLHSEIKQRKLKDISILALPSILLLENKSACILISVEGDEAIISLPKEGGKTSKILLSKLEEQYLGYMILVREMHENEKLELSKPNKNWVWSIMRESVPLYGEVLLASLFINLFALVVPLYVMSVYNRVIPNNGFDTLWVLTSGVIIVFIFDFILKILRSSFLDNASKRADIRISSMLFSHVLGLKMSNRPRSIGALANTIQSFEQFRDFITSTTMTVLIDIPFFFLFVAVLFIIGGNIGYIPLVLTPLILIINILTQSSILKITSKNIVHDEEKQSTLYEGLSYAESIKILCAEGKFLDKWEKSTGLSANLEMKSRFLTNLGMNITAISQQLITVLIVITGVYLIAKNQLSVGALVACVIIGGRTLTPIIQASLILNKYLLAKSALAKINEIIRLPIERPITKTSIHLPELKGKVTFRNVSFSYTQDTQAVLKNINLNINPGEKIGIIGRLGTGKSTIGKLILGLYSADEGNVLLDDIDVTQLDPSDIRNNIGYVPQDVKLFNTTVRNNITIRQPAVNDEILLHAANIAGVTNFTKYHPKGLDLEVGNNGEYLSGGQRQAIAIARSLIGENDIFIFDEPTNSMDDNSTLSFIQSFIKYYNDKTLILITHKASVINFVDRLIVVDQGTIVADGPKKQVLASLKKVNQDKASANEKTL